VRVGIWDIARAEPLLRLRLAVAGRLLMVGPQHELKDADVARARQRQANNCSAAIEVRDALVSKLDPSESGDAEPAIPTKPGP